MKKKGFTLVELLAVILILGVIALIAIPIITNIVKEAKKGAFKANMESIVRTVQNACELEQIENTEHVSSYTFNDGHVTPTLEIKGGLSITGSISVNDECEVSFTNITDGKYYASKGSINGILVTTDTSETQTDYQSGYLAGQEDGYESGYQAGLAAASKTIKKTLLGTYSQGWGGAKSKTYDATGLTDYHNLTIEDFYVEVTAVTGTAEGTAYSYTAKFTKSYNAETGILTISDVVGSCSGHWGGISASTFNLYLLTVE